MKAKYKQFLTFVVAIISLLMTNCKKDVKICTNYTELSDSNHLVDISAFNSGASELIDTLSKHQNLQVYKIINDQYTYGMHCNVFYKGLKIFTDQYSLFKRKSDNSVHSISYYIVDSINISLTPTLQFDKAIAIAKQNMNFDKTCISYRLGIYDLNAGSSYQPKKYKLVWKIQGENKYPIVVLDANTGQIYSKDDGIRI